MPSGLLFTVAVLEELKLLASVDRALGRRCIAPLCDSPDILRLYALESDSTLRLRACEFATDRAGEGGTIRTVRSLDRRDGR